MNMRSSTTPIVKRKMWIMLFPSSKKGSKEELDLKLRQLDLQREAEITAAEKQVRMYLSLMKSTRRKNRLFTKNMLQTKSH